MQYPLYHAAICIKETLTQLWQHFNIYVHTITYHCAWKWEVRKSTDNNHDIIYTAKVKNLHIEQSSTNHCKYQQRIYIKLKFSQYKRGKDYLTLTEIFRK